MSIKGVLQLAQTHQSNLQNVNMVLLSVLAVLFLLFAFVDVWYIIRFLLIAVRSRFNKRDFQRHPYTEEELTKDFTNKGIVLPSDLDVFLHMNNSKFFKEFDLARIDMAAKIGFLDVLKKHGGFFVVGAGNIRYRRSLKLFQRYAIKTRIVNWDEKAFYIEQKMIISKGFVAAVMYTKIAMKGITTEVFIKEFCGENIPSPEPTAEIKSWSESLELSSKSLNGEVPPLMRRHSITSLQR